MPQFRFNTISRTDIESSLGGAQMIRAIDYDGSDYLLITGVAGSGKTTVSIMRAERLVIMSKKILLVTYQDLLVESLKNIASNRLAPHITKFHKWYYRKTNGQMVDDKDQETMLQDLINCDEYDEVIIDEGQNFDAKIHRTLIEKCTKITIGADNAQKVHEYGIKADEIKAIMAKKGKLLPIPLQYNYRNTFEIYNFARSFVPNNERANNNLAIDKIPKGRGQTPTVFVVPDENTRLAQLNILLRDAGDRNVAVLVYKIEEVEEYYRIISSELGIPCTMHHNKNHVGNNIENVIVTTFKSGQGLEFQVVIMPNMETAKNTAYKTDEHYYVGCTRAKENLFLITKGASLPWYFKDFDKGSFKLNNVSAMQAPTKPQIASDADDLPF
jgi:superfamily I DNA/RNA helicase